MKKALLTILALLLISVVVTSCSRDSEKETTGTPAGSETVVTTDDKTSEKETERNTEKGTEQATENAGTEEETVDEEKKRSDPFVNQPEIWQ